MEAVVVRKSEELRVKVVRILCLSLSTVAEDEIVRWSMCCGTGRSDDLVEEFVVRIAFF